MIRPFTSSSMISHGSTKRIYEWAGAVQCSIHRALSCLLWGQSIRLFPVCAKLFDDSGLFTLGHVIIAAHRRDWNGDIFISMKFSLVAATEVVKIIIVGAFSDGNFAKMTPFLFQRWLFWHLISRLPRALHISTIRSPVAAPWRVLLSHRKSPRLPSIGPSTNFKAEAH